MSKLVDLNLDAGESLAALQDGSEEKLYGIVTSISVACGGHAGDEQTMSMALDLAKKYNLKVGAHPSYPDRENFGRKELQISDADLTQSLIQQVNRLKNICDQKNIQLTHLKPHGALYNLAAEDFKLTSILVEVVKTVQPDLQVMMLAGSSAISWLKEAGISTLSEGFIDRRYEANGSLRSRKFPDAMIENAREASEQAVSLVLTFAVPVETLCIHGDSPNALHFAQTARAGLEAAGIFVE